MPPSTLDGTYVLAMYTSRPNIVAIALVVGGAPAYATDRTQKLIMPRDEHTARIEEQDAFRAFLERKYPRGDPHERNQYNRGHR